MIPLLLLVAAIPVELRPDQPGQPTRRQVAGWCAAADATPDARRCLDYIYSVANLVDRSRVSMKMPQCVPPAAKPADLRAIAARALTAKRPGDVEGPAAIIAGALVDTFHCTSDKPAGATPLPLSLRPPNGVRQAD